ncbi:hypothetical protein [Streptomyces coeruleorubidus]|uniref:Uncharacterized protein n=1 Tax=Streptomyces coeruleorubidus TaxID=116188 RepID=A0A5J6HRG5_STRC4|nr:hypothetical protein [Streptomyces coeruleorubidus]QEV22816.1 hypothetical protein CP976_00480 [Streptomyces coeruleorubidus]GGU03350.1 hypothetical protein GCM10010256_74310 [Streptomyces coeruleorubidus]
MNIAAARQFYEREGRLRMPRQHVEWTAAATETAAARRSGSDDAADTRFDSATFQGNVLFEQAVSTRRPASGRWCALGG